MNDKINLYKDLETRSFYEHETEKEHFARIDKWICEEIKKGDVFLNMIFR